MQRKIKIGEKNGEKKKKNKNRTTKQSIDWRSSRVTSRAKHAVTLAGSTGRRRWPSVRHRRLRRYAYVQRIPYPRANIIVAFVRKTIVVVIVFVVVENAWCEIKFWTVDVHVYMYILDANEFRRGRCTGCVVRIRVSAVDKFRNVEGSSSRVDSFPSLYARAI